MTNLEKAIKNLQDFLDKNPHMKKDQEKLERMLNRLEDSKSRMFLIKGMMQENLEKLTEKLLELEKEVNDANSKLRK